MYDIPFDRSFLQLSNGIRHVMPSTDRRLELTAKASMAQPVSQPAVYCNGLKVGKFKRTSVRLAENHWAQFVVSICPTLSRRADFKSASVNMIRPRSAHAPS